MEVNGEECNARYILTPIYILTQNLLALRGEKHHLIVMKMNLNISALTESRLTGGIDNNEVRMPCYSMLRCDSDSRSTGGVTLFVRNDIRYEIILTRMIEPNCWNTAIE